MRIKNYNELNSLELDTLREVGSIGTGNCSHSALRFDRGGGAHRAAEVRHGI